MQTIKIGSTEAIFVADADDAAINGSSEGSDGITLTNFSIFLYQDGEEVADESTVVNAPYLFTLDNVGNGRYKANITLPAAGYFSLHVKNTDAMAVWRVAEWDCQLELDLIGDAQADGNRRVTFTKAGSPVPARNVATGMIDYMTVDVKRPDDSDWSSPVSTHVVYYWYENLGDQNPIKVGETA
jgi:hypothetical protein